MSKQNKKNYSMFALPLAIVIAVVMGIVLFMVFQSVLLPKLDHISVYDSMQRTIKVTGQLRTASGNPVSVSSISLTGKMEGSEPVIGQVSSDLSTFTLQDVSFGTSYKMELNTSDGRKYEADVLFFQDAEQTTYSNMADGIDFALLNTADAINIVLVVNDHNSLNCTDCSSSATKTF
ncbi:MAG: hypothetical protein IJ589_05115 [Lachnospiraceae bacterium]|nr:hypothetical protein [Lachnospiraceae bacterium]